MNLILAIQLSKKFFAAPAAALLALLLVPAQPAAGADTLRVTLAEVIEHALSASPRILAAGKSVEQAEGYQLSSLAGFLPQLKVSEVFSRGNDPVFAFGTKLRQARFAQADFSLGQLNQPSALTNYATRFVVEQPIFNGGKSLYGRRQATAFRNAADNAAQAVREQTLFGIRRAYYSLILTRENLKVIDAALASARSHRHQASQMLETGMVTRADELKASVRVSELEQQRIRALNAVEILSENLKLASGWRTGSFLFPAEGLSEFDFDFDPDSLTAFALANQGELGAVKNTARAAEFGARAAWGELIPRLNGFFQYEKDGRKAFAEDGDNWMVGISLDWYPFSGFGNLGRIKSKRAEKEKAAYEASLARHKVEVDVRESFLDATAAKKMIAVARQAESQAEESLRIVENQYREGLATITDLLDTELARTNTRLSLVNAMFEYNAALARLSMVTGGYPVNGRNL